MRFFVFKQKTAYDMRISDWSSDVCSSDLQNSTGPGSQGGDKAFGGLINEGLKDLTAASSDTRVDDFANRLAALTQAATPKTANAIPEIGGASCRERGCQAV